MNKNLSVLGSTGSIGKQTLQVAEHLNINIAAIAANGSDPALIVSQAKRFKPDIVAVFDPEAAERVKKELKGTSSMVLSGEQGVIEAARYEKADTAVCAIVGNAGLKPVFEAIDAKKTIALANKEALVSSGELLLKTAKEKNVAILPVDSEHSAIFQCLDQQNNNKPKSIILTASGGPFRGKKRAELTGVTPKDAVAHPTWSMGGKISVDSATLMNKGLEVIEARLLFNVSEENIRVVVHPQSIIHSAVEFSDGSVIAQLGVPDMRNPIQYALTYPARMPSLSERLELAKIGNLSFEEPDKETFTCLGAAYKALKKGGSAMCALNAANETAVRAFLNNKIGFTDIFDIVNTVTDSYTPLKNYDLNVLLAEDEKVRTITGELIKNIYMK